MAIELSNMKPDYEEFGKAVVSIIDRYGFGVLPKSDWDSEILFALLNSIANLESRDSFGRAEALGITDQRYKSLISKAGMRHGSYQSADGDQELLTKYLVKAIRRFVENPAQGEIRIVEDDELRRRDLLRAIERSESAVELAVTGHAVVMRAADFEHLLTRLNKNNELHESVVSALSKKNRNDRLKSVASAVREVGVDVFVETVTRLSFAR